MPSKGPLKPAIIDMFAQWITDGMPERRS